MRGRALTGRRSYPGAIAACGLLALAGCGTLEQGATEDLYVSSEPPGAFVSLSTSTSTCTTPCSVGAPRGQDVVVTVGKEGFQSQQIYVPARALPAGVTISHDLTIDYLGRVVDSRTGADTIHVPNPVVVTLKPDK